MSFILCIRTLTITKIMYLMIFCYFFFIETREEVYRFLYEKDLSRIYTTHSNCEGINENANFNACQNCIEGQFNVIVVLVQVLLKQIQERCYQIFTIYNFENETFHNYSNHKAHIILIVCDFV